MPNESLNIYLAAIDGMSPVLASIGDKTKALDKETQELQQTYVNLQKAQKTLIERKTELETQLKAVNKEVKEAKKQLNELGDEASSDAFNKAAEKQRALRDQISATTKAMQENQKIYRENIESIRKGELDGSGAGLSRTSGLDMSVVWSGLGIGEAVSSLVGQAGSTLASSVFGNDVGGMVSGALSSAISGAALGSAIAPITGTAIGAAVGGLSGLVGSAIDQWGSQDDAFKEYYGGLYDDVKGRSGEMVEGGSTIAGSREQTRMAFAQRLGGEDKADTYLAQVEKMAASTNYDYDEIVGYAKLLLNSYDPGEVFDVLRDLSDATAGLDLSSSDVNMMISGLSRMRTTGKATQEYLNYFRERGIDTDQALADSLKVDKSAVADMVKKGEIGGENAAEAILAYIQEMFGGLSDDLAGTYDAMMDNLGDVEASINAAGGEAYNSLRKSGITAQQEAYEGELGEAMKEINAVMGENQARRDNLQEQYMREVKEAVLEGKHGELWDKLSEKQQNDLSKMAEQYAQAQQRYEESGRTDWDAGAEMEKLYEATLVAGQSYFDNSAEIAMLNEKEIDEIALIRENSAGLLEATQNIYRQTQELSKGMAFKVIKDNYGSTIAEGEGGDVSHLTTVGGHLGVAEEKQEGYYGYNGIWHPHAFGLDRVPYDEYPALLHRDERVLTASQARAQDAGQGGTSIQLIVTGNDFVGTGEEMADQVAEIIARKLRQAATAAAPK